MSAQIPFDPRCSLCHFGVIHEIDRHENSIAMTERLERMAGPQASEPGAAIEHARKRIRLTELQRQSEMLSRCIANYERASIHAGTHAEWSDTLLALRERRERMESEISALRLELEAQR